MSGACAFCTRSGEVRAGEGGAPEDVRVCGGCWKLLQDPATALPLLRGDLSVSLRGRVPEAVLKRSIDRFMETVSKFKRPG